MGKRVQIILSSKAELGKREIYFLFVNTTSFDELEILNTAAKECKCYDDLKEYLLEFTQFSNIANRNEGFTIDDEPFGDYEYIVLVQENDNNEFTITKMYFFDYSVSKTQIEEKFNFFDEINIESLIADQDLSDEDHIKLLNTKRTEKGYQPFSPEVLNKAIEYLNN